MGKTNVAKLLTALHLRHPGLSEEHLKTIILNPRILGRDQIISELAGPVNTLLLINLIMHVLVKEDVSAGFAELRTEVMSCQPIAIEYVKLWRSKPKSHFRRLLPAELI